jgi:double zinc ribbon protein
MPITTTKRNSNSSFSDELRMIPRWSIALALAAFVLMEYIFWVVMPAYRHHAPPPIGLRLYFALSWGALTSLYVLMVGYVSKDAPRRGSSVRLWVVVCVVMPGGIGAVLYFLLRPPVVSLCPACNTSVQAEYHFCPQCAYQITASCGNCYRTVRITDLYCVHCGHDLAKDNMPSRLHRFSNN